MKVGILGTGFGAYHVSIYKKLDCVEGIKIFGRNEDKLRELRDSLGIAVTNSIDEILLDPEIDFVDICLPSELHREYAVKALEKGKHIFCEIPVSMTLEDAEAIRDAGKQYGKKVFVNLFIRFFAEYSFIYEAVRNNTYGNLKAFHIRRKTPPIWGDLGLARMPISLMIHDFDFITWILGVPEKISSIGIQGEPGESHITAILSYRDTVVEITGSSMLPKGYPFTAGYEAIFEKGTVEYCETFEDAGNERRFIEYSCGRKREPDLLKMNPYEMAIKHALECCNRNTPSIIGIEDALESLELALTIKAMVSEK